MTKKEIRGSSPTVPADLGWNEMKSQPKGIMTTPVGTLSGCSKLGNSSVKTLTVMVSTVSELEWIERHKRNQ